MPTDEARRQAREAGLDLVEVAPNARPPVCRILDYGKFKYEQKKKQSKTKNTSAILKEIRVRPKIDKHDLEIKVKKARQFLEEGHKVQVTCLFRGREMAYQHIGIQVMQRVVEALQDVSKVEREPRREGRRQTLLLTSLSATAPRPAAGKSAPKLVYRPDRPQGSMGGPKPEKKLILKSDRLKAAQADADSSASPSGEKKANEAPEKPAPERVEGSSSS